ncbi:MAG: dipicolinate synthase subunit B [Firmicutes bacterium]|nr:dipicolinate synthase subunit B [Bacillota bacterium]
MCHSGLNGLKIGFALTGSHCSLAKALSVMAALKEQGGEILPILSPSVQSTDSRFGEAVYWRREIRRVSGAAQIIDSIPLAEPIGPKKLLDILLICPCSGNTLAKLAAGITDTPVLMAAKAHLRIGRPLTLAVATNDALSANAKNIGQLLNCKNVFFVPFRQDAPFEKPNSLVAAWDLVAETLLCALEYKQKQPLLLASPAPV